MVMIKACGVTCCELRTRSATPVRHYPYTPQQNMSSERDRERRSRDLLANGNGLVARELVTKEVVPNQEEAENYLCITTVF